MNNKSLIQILALILIIVSIYLVGTKLFIDDPYLADDKIENIENPSESLTASDSDVTELSLIESLQYKSIDSLGNEYIINCESAISSTDDENVLNLKKVSAVVYIKNKSPIFIDSDFAIYNKNSFNTNFYGNVKVINDITKILSENLDLIYEDNLVNLYNIKEVFYDKTKLIADNVKFDLLTKDISINMNDKNKKIGIYLN